MVRRKRKENKKRHSYHERLKSCDRFTSTWLSLSLSLSPAFFVQLIPPVTHSRSAPPFSISLGRCWASTSAFSLSSRDDRDFDRKESNNNNSIIYNIICYDISTNSRKKRIYCRNSVKLRKKEREKKKIKFKIEFFISRKIRLRPCPRVHRPRWCIAWQWHHRPPDNQLSSVGSVSTAKRTE